MPRSIFNPCAVDADATSDGSPVDDVTIHEAPVNNAADDGSSFDDVITEDSQSQPMSPSRKKMRSSQPWKSTNPSVQDMMATALRELKTHKGVSMQAIKKYLETQYGFDWRRKKHILRRSLEAGLKSGLFIRKGGKGANGRFRLGVDKARVEKERQQRHERLHREREKKKYKETQLKEKEQSRKRIQRAKDKARKDAAETKRRIMEAREKVKKLAAERKAMEEEKWANWRKQVTIMFK